MTLHFISSAAHSALGLRAQAPLKLMPINYQYRRTKGRRADRMTRQIECLKYPLEKRVKFGAK